VAKALRTLVVAAGALLLSACHANHEDRVRSLAGSWAFHSGDNSGWAAPGFDDSSWARLQVPLSWGVQGYQDVSGMAWYRIRASHMKAPKMSSPKGHSSGHSAGGHSGKHK
jgi:hypothetical protein